MELREQADRAKIVSYLFLLFFSGRIRTMEGNEASWSLCGQV